jgi:hypothetical protein
MSRCRISLADAMESSQQSVLIDDAGHGSSTISGPLGSRDNPRMPRMKRPTFASERGYGYLMSLLGDSSLLRTARVATAQVTWRFLAAVRGSFKVSNENARCTSCMSLRQSEVGLRFFTETQDILL